LQLCIDCPDAFAILAEEVETPQEALDFYEKVSSFKKY
jgi:hypothetical protein